jgi:hypothetical protein
VPLPNHLCRCACMLAECLHGSLVVWYLLSVSNGKTLIDAADTYTCRLEAVSGS